jgi:hypothetical protein
MARGRGWSHWWQSFCRCSRRLDVFGPEPHGAALRAESEPGQAAVLEHVQHRRRRQAEQLGKPREHAAATSPRHPVLGQQTIGHAGPPESPVTEAGTVDFDAQRGRWGCAAAGTSPALPLSGRPIRFSPRHADAATAATPRRKPALKGRGSATRPGPQHRDASRRSVPTARTDSRSDAKGAPA